MKNKMLADRRVVKIDQLKENDNRVPPIGIGIIWDITTSQVMSKNCLKSCNSYQAQVTSRYL